MTQEHLDALAELVGSLESQGIDYWVFGGWAVDLHLGRISRPHADIDIAIWQLDEHHVASLLEQQGWGHTPSETEDGYTTYRRRDVHLEVAFLVRDGATVSTPTRAGRAAWADGAFGNEVGAIGNVRARVIGYDALLAEKSEPHGDEATAAKDRRDVVALAKLGRPPRAPTTDSIRSRPCARLADPGSSSPP